jgi:hypothetical protein
MKRKTYMVFCIMCFICLSTACAVQAGLYVNCTVIANGRSQGRSTTGDWCFLPTYRRYLNEVDFYGCSDMSAIVIGKGINGRGIFIIHDITYIRLSDALGRFTWRVFPAYFFNIPPKTFIIAHAMVAVIT